MPERDRERAPILSYPTPPKARERGPILAILLALPGFLCAILIPFSIWTERIDVPILLLSMLAVAASFVALAEYQPMRPKPVYVIACLTVSWCVVALTVAYALFVPFALTFLDFD